MPGTLAGKKDLAPHRKFDLHFTFEYFVGEVWHGSGAWDTVYNYPLSSIDRLIRGYPDMMDHLVVKTSDVKNGLLDDVNDAVTEFYSLLGSVHVVTARERKQLQERIEEEYPGVLERMESYNREGRGPGVTSSMKEEARERIYPRIW